MLGAKTLELLNDLAQYIRGNNKPFGGIQVVFTGDMLQNPPINDEFCFKSKVWKEFNFAFVRLMTPYRFSSAKDTSKEEYFQLLLRARMGELNKDDIEKLQKQVKAYQEYLDSNKNKTEEIKPTRLFSMKKNVEDFNLLELNKLSSKTEVYTHQDKFFPKVSKDRIEQTQYQQYLDTIIPPKIILKVDAQVMLTYNLDVENGLVNGSRGVVKECLKDGVKVLFRKRDSTEGFLVKILPHVYEYEDERVKITRKQIPLILSWASTIHKVQGCTLDYVIIDLGTSIFSPALAYVGMSRARTLESMLLINFIPAKVYAHPEAVEFENMMTSQI
jgi:ATP-dependent DNA helicase PIF1